MKTLSALVALLLVSGPALAAAPPTAKQTIAISYFDNNTGDDAYAPLSKGLADMLITDLSNVSALQIVERKRLEDVLAEMKLGESRFIDPKTAQKLGRGLAAQYIMTGGYMVVGDTMRIDCRIIKVETAEVVAGQKVEGAKADFFAMEKELVDLLIDTLKLNLAFKEKSRLRANQTQSFDAWWQYSAGLAARDAGDDAEARKRFQAALDADPGYQAAKNATERLAAIFAADDSKQQQQQAALFQSLDPKADDFGAKINALLGNYDQNDPVQFGQKVALLRYLADRDLTPGGPGGYSRVPMEILMALNTYLSDPDMAAVVPRVCEYVITRYPKDLMAKPQCKAFLKVLESYEKFDLKQRRKMWDGSEKSLSLDRELARKKHDAALRQLLRLYAGKVRH